MQVRKKISIKILIFAETFLNEYRSFWVRKNGERN